MPATAENTTPRYLYSATRSSKRPPHVQAAGGTAAHAAPRRAVHAEVLPGDAPNTRTLVLSTLSSMATPVRKACATSRRRCRCAGEVPSKHKSSAGIPPMRRCWEGLNGSKPYQGPRWGWRALDTLRPQLWLEQCANVPQGKRSCCGALKETTLLVPGNSAIYTKRVLLVLLPSLVDCANPCIRAVSYLYHLRNFACAPVGTSSRCVLSGECALLACCPL